MSLQSKYVFAYSVTASVLTKLYAPSLCVSKSLYWNVAALYFSFILSRFVWKVFIYPFFLSPLRNLPQPPGGNILFGQAINLLRAPTGQPHRSWVASLPNAGVIYYRWMLNSPRLLVVSPKAIAEVTSHKSYEFIKPRRVREGLGRVLGIGILLAEGDEHRHQRRLMGPAFGFGTVRGLVGKFWQVAGELVAGIEEQVTTQVEASKAPTGKCASEENLAGDPDVVHIDDWASRATLDIIGLTGFSQSFHALKDPSNELYQTYRSVFSGRRPPAILQMAGEVIPMWILRLLPLKRYEEMKKAVRVIKTVAGDIVVKKRAEVEKADQENGEKNTAHGSDDDDDENESPDILTTLIRTNAFSNSDLVNQLMTLLAAGHETTASALTWAIYLLCHFPDIQTQVRAEIRANLPSPSDPHKTATAPLLDSCKLLNAVMMETLRVFPPVPMTLRVASTDTSIDSIPVPAGTDIIICPWAINVNPVLWGPDAADFRPQRWLKGGSGGAENNYAFGTFIHGPRSCIGREFARGEYAALLAGLVGRFELTLDEKKMNLKTGEWRDVGIQGGVTSRPKGGLWCRIRAVEGVVGMG